jgi:hypothetical protein
VSCAHSAECCDLHVVIVMRSAEWCECHVLNSAGCCMVDVVTLMSDASSMCSQ